VIAGTAPRACGVVVGVIAPLREERLAEKSVVGWRVHDDRKHGHAKCASDSEPNRSHSKLQRTA
jgi:hypothetical protein